LIRQAPVSPSTEEKPTDPEPTQPVEEDTDKSENEETHEEGESPESTPEDAPAGGDEEMEATEKKAQKDALNCCGVSIPVE